MAAGRTPVAIVGNAGDVNTGIVDPLPQMAAIAREHGIWFHVDGAYGGWGVLDERVEPAYGDRGLYDSFAVDPHKWLAAPVGTGLAICRDGDLLARAFTIEPGHYDRERNVEHPPDGRCAGAVVVAGWRHARLGRRLLDARSRYRRLGRAQGDRCGRHARAGAAPQRLRPHGGCTRRAEDRSSSCWPSRSCRSAASATGRSAGTTRSASTRSTTQILAELRREGRSLPSSTRVDGALAIRACYINPRNDREHVELLVEDVLAIGRRLTKG